MDADGKESNENSEKSEPTATVKTSNVMRTKHDTICNALELDHEIGESAWTLFASLNDTYTLAVIRYNYILYIQRFPCLPLPYCFHRDGPYIG